MRLYMEANTPALCSEQQSRARPGEDNEQDVHPSPLLSPYSSISVSLTPRKKKDSN